ncbi:MAG: hypothetical protein ACXQS6_01745 [Candidatus Syntropharchaeales archaeon]
MNEKNGITTITAVALALGILFITGLPVAMAQEGLHTNIGHAGSALFHFIVAQIAVALLYITYKSMKETGQVQTFAFFMAGAGLLAILSLLKMSIHISGFLYRTFSPNIHDIDIFVTLIAYILMTLTFYKWSELLK